MTDFMNESDDIFNEIKTSFISHIKDANNKNKTLAVLYTFADNDILTMIHKERLLDKIQDYLDTCHHDPNGNRFFIAYINSYVHINSICVTWSSSISEVTDKLEIISNAFDIISTKSLSKDIGTYISGLVRITPIIIPVFVVGTALHLFFKCCKCNTYHI